MIAPLTRQHVGQTAVDQLVHAIGIDVALVVDAQLELRQVLRGMAPDLLAARFAVEAAEMAGAVQRLVGGVVGQLPALVRAQDREGDDVAVRPHAPRTGVPSFRSTPGLSASG
jgi:hypothetical protein